MTRSVISLQPWCTMSRNRWYLRPIVLGTLLALGCITAGAADKPREATFGKGKATGGGYLTKEQLRSCLAQQTKLTQGDAELQREQAEIVALKNALTRAGEELKEQLAAMDRTNAEAVAAYNDRATARDKAIDDYDARVPSLNARIEGAKTERDGYAKACEGRRYFEEDEAAIKKAR
jgi:hypothetical protein